MSLDNLLDPKTDWVFKLMFTKGEKGNKALISFLNAFLANTYGEIKTADILNTELTREMPNGETYHLDLLVKTDNRLVVNIEMQQFWKSDFSQRIQMYLLNVGHRFLKKHPKPDEPLFAISLTVFGEQVPKTAELPRTSKGSILQYLYIDLNKLIGYTLDKDIDNYTAQDFWIRFLGNYKSDAKTKALKSLCEKNEGVNMANEVLLTVTEEERQIARELSEYKYQLMVQGEREEARNEGLAEGLLEGEKRGIQKGLSRGLAEGIERGIERGLCQGELKKARETAKLLKLLGDPMEKIVKVTGLSESEIDEL